ncbi:MAG: Rpn family recombination-promoting nuclease/putative transposase [Bryobacterales bacterium]|nr:Rpn family recombination-promoting nuclease/putative transposase [Bryobacterales bacterium]
MGGKTPAGPVSANDHDGLFKKLLTTFFVEFLLLFFPKLARSIRRDKIQFVQQERILSLPEGKKYRMDILAKVQFQDTEAFFLIHVEHQSTAPSDIPRRLFRYFSALYEEHNLPVYPIVVYSHDQPLKRQPSVFPVDFPDGKVLRFYYRVVQLNRMSWRGYLRNPNPVANALMAKMRVAAKDRPRVKAECLRLIVTQKLDPARKHLLILFVDRYLPLNEVQEKVFHRKLERLELMPEQREEVLEYVTSWERRGIEKGRQEGRQEGQTEALREVLLEILATRFGPVDERIAAKIGKLDSVDELRRLTHEALSVRSIRKLTL